ncbi:MAG: D-alanyl-D-alanine carboxypeptidase [Solirubrobacteraceae bacterium]|nr:D-alanyl-D-alanine carboxypeptidase [Solirubrobacteraceae bacterium]
MSRRLASRALTGAALVGALAVGPGTATAAPPSITAPAAAVIETSTGTVVYTKNAQQERGMASTTKLMTALVALDRRPLDSVLTAANYRPTAAETRLGLHAGERMTLADLVRAMMLPSANDAAQTVAQRTGGSVSRFVSLMNQRAKEEGLTHTRFTNPVGLDSSAHHTSALDLARMGALAFDNPFLRQTVRRRSITLTSGDMARTITNRNTTLGVKLPGGGQINGMKTGHTNRSGYALVGSATRGGVSVVSAVLGDPSEAARDADTIKLLRWASGLFQRKQVIRERAQVQRIGVDGGKVDSVELVAEQSLTRVVPRGEKITLEPVGVPKLLQAPVAAGTKAGSARVLVGGKLVGTVPLVTAAAVEKQSLPAAIVSGIGDHWQGGLVALLLILSGTLILVRARNTRTPAPRTATQGSPPAEPAERTTAP